MAPSEIRGLIMAFWQLFYSVGSFIAYWITYACSLHRAKLGEWDWKMVVIFQILVPTLILIALPFQPETPRWYIQRSGNIEGARAALRRIRDTEQEVEDEILVIREALSYEREAISPGYSALFKDPSVRRRLYLAFGLNVGQQLTGQGTLNSYSTAIYKKVWKSTQTINLINALNATFGILFTLNATWTADRFGRRWLFLVGAIGMGICMLIVPVVGLATPTAADGTKSQPVGIAIVFLFFLFIFFYKPTWGATTWIWTSEVFSMNVRAQAVGMCSQMQNVANTIVQQFFPLFLASTSLPFSRPMRPLGCISLTASPSRLRPQVPLPLHVHQLRPRPLCLLPRPRDQKGPTRRDRRALRRCQPRRQGRRHPRRTRGQGPRRLKRHPAGARHERDCLSPEETVWPTDFPFILLHTVLVSQFVISILLQHNPSSPRRDRAVAAFAVPNHPRAPFVDYSPNSTRIQRQPKSLAIGCRCASRSSNQAQPALQGPECTK